MRDAARICAAVLLTACAAFAAAGGLEQSFTDQAAKAQASAKTIGSRLAQARTAAAQAAAPAHPAEPFPQIKACVESARKQTFYGGWELKLLTEDTAYYYHEDCDICAAFDACDVKTGRTWAVKQAHSVSCADLKPYRKGRILFDGCTK